MQESGNPYFCMDFLNLQYSILEPGSTVRPATRMSKMKTKSKNANAKIVSTISIFIYKPVLSQIYIFHCWHWKIKNTSFHLEGVGGYNCLNIFFFNSTYNAHFSFSFINFLLKFHLGIHNAQVPSKILIQC